MMPFDPRTLTGPSLVIIGALFLFIALRLWLVHPLNRVFRIGPFVTEEGLRAVLGMRATFFAFGCFFITQGGSGMTYWWIANRDETYPPVVLLGSAATCFSIWAGFLAVRAAWRLWRG